MSNTVEFLEYMTPAEVHVSAKRGTRIATKLRDRPTERRFRFRQTIFLIAMRKGFRAAAETALSLAIGEFTMDEAMRHVRKVFADGKAELKERAS